MQRPQIFLREPRPALRVASRPEIAGQASSQAFAAIVYLDQRLPAVMAATHAGTF